MINRMGTGFDVLALAGIFYFAGTAATVWMIGQGWLGYMADIEMAKAVNTPQTTQAEDKQEHLPDGLTPMRRGWRSWGITQKNKKRPAFAFETIVVQPPNVQKDARWQQFAEGILYHKMPISQAKWTGKGRMFSKTEFAPRINGWVTDGYLATINPHSANQGYKISGSRGRDYFQGLATGREYIPLPHS